jgi:hypothetical protein
MAYTENIISSWNFWCFYKKTIRNKQTGLETFLDSGKFFHDTSGIIRAGIKISDISSTEEIVERTVSVFKPDITRMNNADIPTLAKFKIYFLGCVANMGNPSVDVTIRPWSYQAGLAWVTTTPQVTYEILNNNYLPFDVALEDYDSDIYEYSKEVNLNATSVTFLDLEQTFYKFLQKQCSGFLITAENGYCDIFSPNYSTVGLRPFFTINQITTGLIYNMVSVDFEVTALSKIKGVCRNKDGAIITGKQCEITIFDPNDYKIVGAGLSSLDGSFLVSANYKVGLPVVVSFTDETQEICGSEIMITVSNLTT